MRLRYLGMVDMCCLLWVGEREDTIRNWCGNVYAEFLEYYGYTMGLQSIYESLAVRGEGVGLEWTRYIGGQVHRSARQEKGKCWIALLFGKAKEMH